MMPTDVLVVGAGPSGLSMATALAARGIRVVVVDPAGAESLAAPPDDGREIALTPLSRDLLDSWEQWTCLSADEHPPLRQALVFDGQSSRPMMVTPDGDAHELGFMVSNHALRRIAFARARQLDGIQWRLGRKVLSVRRDAGEASVELDDGERIAGQLVIAADSRFSAIRRSAGIAAEMHDFGRSMLVCRMRLQHPQPGVAWEWLDYGQTLALLPLNDDLASVVITLPPTEIETLRTMTPTDFESEAARRFRQRLGNMQLVGERFAYPLVGVHPQQCVARRLALIGDAAVGMHPITAHGYNLALRGIALLAERLCDAHAQGRDLGDPRLLDGYQREFRAVTRPLYLATQAIARLFSDDRPPARVLRRAGIRFGEHFRPFQSLLTAVLSTRDPHPPFWMRAVERLLWQRPRGPSR